MGLVMSRIGLLLASVMLSTFIVASPAIAAGHQGSPTPTPGTPTTGTPTPNKYCQTYKQALAKQLGVSQQQLEMANQSALKTTLQQAVADGNLTQTQANRIEQKILAHVNGCQFGDHAEHGHTDDSSMFGKP